VVTDLDRIFRDEWGRVLAALIGFLGDFELAEEAAQDAFAAAAERWPREGTPANPRAWLVTTGRNRAIDRIRRNRTLAEKTRLLEVAEATEDVIEDSAIPDERLELVWSWLTDPEVDFGALLVRPAGGGPAVGLAHYRPYLRPLAGSVGGYLDDLFVHPAARGGGAVDALLSSLREIGLARGWSKIRWITADDNYRARSKYDRVAERTTWVTYDMWLDD